MNIYLDFKTGNGSRDGQYVMSRNIYNNNVQFNDYNQLNSVQQEYYKNGERTNRLDMQRIQFIYNIKPCTNEEKDCSQDFLNNGGEPKKTYSVQKGWNLSALTTNKSIAFSLFEDVYSIWTYNSKQQSYNTPLSAKVENIEKLIPREGFWINQGIESKNYNFPGVATENTELTEEYLTSVKDIKGWQILGTGRDIPAQRLTDKFFPVWIFDTEKNDWIHPCNLYKSNYTIKAGTGIWVLNYYNNLPYKWENTCSE